MSGLEQVERKLIRPIRQRLRNLIGRAVLRLANDAAAIQRLQLQGLAGEDRDLIERIQQYGFSSVPLAGAHPVILLAPFGDRGQVVAIAVDDIRHRPSGLEPGDTIQYDNRGNRVHLKDGLLEVTAVADLRIVVNGNATVECAGTVAVECDDIELGNGTLRKLCDDRLIAYLASHAHSGVQSGGSNTGPPTAPPAVDTHTTTQTVAS